MKHKNIQLLMMIYAVVFVVYNIILFLIFNDKGTVFWINYGFLIVAFVTQLLSLLFSLKKPNIETIFFGIPLISLSFFYLMSTVVVSLLFMFYQQIGITITVIIHLIIFTIFFVIAVLALMAKDAIIDLNESVKITVQTHKNLNIDVDSLMSYAKNPTSKEAIRKLSEIIKYSDPMSNESVAKLDELIKLKIGEMKLQLELNNDNSIKSTCSEIESLYKERNQRLLNSK
jgi:hypothetical protein